MIDRPRFSADFSRDDIITASNATAFSISTAINASILNRTFERAGHGLEFLNTQASTASPTTLSSSWAGRFLMPSKEVFARCVRGVTDARATSAYHSPHDLG